MQYLSGFFKQTRNIGWVAGTAAVLLAAGAAAQTIPSDPKPTCTVSPPTFASWFESGTPSANGAVKPANSVTFSPASNCNFYLWSQQMFLWLTSPTTAAYGGRSHIFNSNAFYQVVPNSGGGLKFLANSSTLGPLGLNLRAAQVDANGLQLLFDRNHVAHEIEPAPLTPAGKPLLRNATGKLVEVERATVNAAGVPTFLDKAGKAIAPKPQFKAQAAKGQPARVQQLTVNGHAFFLDPFGNPIVPDQGQAGGNGVLVAQNHSLVYYATFVNDVYAYYLTMVKNADGGNTPTGTKFPTTQADLNTIVAYAAAHTKKFPDPDALAIEVKTSWVELTGLDAGKYVTIQARVPVYNKTPSIWTPTSATKIVTLGLVGMHVVGSVTNHPEMVWATHEHTGNSPNGAYDYLNAAGGVTHVPQNTNGSWLFCQTNCANPTNVELAKVSGSNIVSTTSAPIGPSDTIRWKAWGASIDKAPNPLVTTAAQSNADVISINNSVLSLLAPTDIRRNYFMVGSTWTNSGAVPNGAYASPPPNNLTEIGTSQLANTTMETYQQGASNAYNKQTNCMLCHNKNVVQVSHIWTPLKSLFP